MSGTDSYHYGIASLQGQRADNQDCAGVFADVARPGDLLAIVSDGLGGHRGGRVASHMAIDEFVARYRALSSAHEPHAAARQALAAVNRAIHARGSREPALANMGTTFTALILVGPEAHVLHVGDTRAYRLRAGRIVQLTRDHNRADEGQPNLLYRAVGTDPEVKIDLAVHDTRAGDRYLLCSDGVHGVLPDAVLAALLDPDHDMQQAAEQIVATALAAGSTDNVTAVTISVGDIQQASE